MDKKYIKIISIIFLVIILILGSASTTYAGALTAEHEKNKGQAALNSSTSGGNTFTGTTGGSTSLSDILAQGKDFINKGSQDEKISQTNLANTFIPIARILVAIGTVVLVVVTAIMGIQYMVASPDEKAKLKVKLVGLVVSTVVIFGAQAIWSTLYEFFNSL